MPDLSDIADRVAGWARDGEQVEAYVSRSRNTEIKVFDGGIESLSQADSEGIGIRIIAGSRQGFAYAGSFDEAVIAETLADARDNATFATDDDCNGLASADGVLPVALDLWRDELASFPPDQKVELALDLERRVKAGDPRIRAIESTAWTDNSMESAIATSTGIRASSRATACYAYSVAIAGAGDDTQTGFGVTVGRQPSDLDVDECVRDAIDKSTRLLGATKPASAKLTVVLDRDVTSTLLSILASTLNGESVSKGRSLFANRLGEQVAAKGITLVDDPTNPEALGSAPYDAEGLASRRNGLIEDGELKQFVYNTYAARRAATTSTASAVRAGFKGGPGVGCRAVSLVPGDLSLEEILAKIGDGFLVQSMSGIHSGVNPISGDFSVGAEGMMIRGGAMAEPVREVTIASTLQRMLLDVVAVGNDLKWGFGSSAGVTLAIDDVSMGGA
ncbi:MAG TPA: TldD/PmbA family protein [Acidimicrobiales bacterium]|nr:TldD/PmbA family protein [Acidimicrobiales bacterium]